MKGKNKVEECVLTDVDVVEAVAKAIFDEIWGGASAIEAPWELANDGQKEDARLWARAAIDAYEAAMDESVVGFGQREYTDVVRPPRVAVEGGNQP